MITKEEEDIIVKSSSCEFQMDDRVMNLNRVGWVQTRKEAPFQPKESLKFQV